VSQPQHPSGLYVLFFTELGERYSFYSLMAILTLYMDESLRFRPEVIGQVYGGFVAAVFFMPLVGGIAADRWLGFYRAVIAGGLLIAAGQLVLGAGTLFTFFTGLILLACGTGLLKPNVSTIVGNLYADRPELRDAGFNIFYMGINIGSFIAPIIVSYLRHAFGWRVAFASAAAGVLFALAVFVGFRRHLGAAGRPAPSLQTEASDGSSSRSRVVALLIVFAIVVAFWIAFYQNGFTLTLWARDNTATRLAPETFQSVNPLGIILFSPVLVTLWAALRRRGREPSTLWKILIGMAFTIATFGTMAAAGFAGGDHGRVSAAWLIAAYLMIALAEICLSPMGLSLVSRIAPRQHRGTMMGAWFAATAVGGYLAGFLGTFWYRMPHSVFFLLVAGVAAFAAVVLLVARPGLQAVFAAASGRD
jgi:POT family proton-dependent oligopeptide transporter